MSFEPDRNPLKGLNVEKALEPFEEDTEEASIFLTGEKGYEKGQSKSFESIDIFYNFDISPI